jgi:CRP-like cAMP-binding protein
MLYYIVTLVTEPGEKPVEELLVKLYRGQTFGETALDNEKGTRTAGAKASQATYLLSLNVADYKRIFSNYKVQLKNEVRELLSTSAVFNTWEDDTIDKLASNAVVQSFGGGQTLMQSGHSVSTLYIIKCGVVKLLKDVTAPDVSNIQISEFFTPDTHDCAGMENPGLWVLKKNWKDRVLTSTSQETRAPLKPFTVGVLGSGQVFGELAVLSPGSPSPTTAITFTNVEVYKFESDLLLALGAKFNSSTVNVLNESLNLYNPPDEKVGHYYRSKYSWETRKRKILKSLVKDRPVLKGKFHELDH